MLDKNEIDIKMGGGFNPVPADKYTVQIADVSLVDQFNKFTGKEQTYLNFQFIILDDNPMPEKDETTRERYLWKRMSQTLNPKSNLFKFVKAVYGRALTPEELKEFSENPDNILGRQVDAMVKQNPGNDGTTIYNNIIDFSTTAKELETVEFTPQPQDVEVTSEPVETEDPLPPVAGLDDFPGEDAPEPDPDEVKKTARTAKKKK